MKRRKTKRTQHKNGGGVKGSRNARDVSNRSVLKDPLLCAQFLKDYVDGSLFKDLRPEDIEDESEKYQAYLGIAFETDTVKKIRIRANDRETVPVYLISLVEHKSRVDYNVSMQLLRYMVCIWNEYAREMAGRGKGDPRNKSFRYPPIIPIIYYEGAESWSADLNLRDRILMNDIFSDFIPDFTYKLVRCHDYTNEELLENKDEMSLLMTLGKVQTVEDVSRLVTVEKDKVEGIIRKAPEHLLEVIASTIWSLCMKMNVPQEEAAQYTRKVREGQMGYWFENMEKMDIQAERRNTAKARAELEEKRKEIEKIDEELKGKNEELKGKEEELKGKNEEIQRMIAQETENRIGLVIDTLRELDLPREQIVTMLMKKCGLDEAAAAEKVDLSLR